MKFIAGAVLLCLASAAGATNLVGGGATLPAIGYTGSATFPLPAGTGPITPGGGSLFGVYNAASGNTSTYCPIGSGGGKKVLAGNDSANFQVNLACGPTTTPATPQGFGGSGLAQADFAASDAPMSSSEFANYRLGHGSTTQPVQLPAIAGSIAVVFKKSGVSSLTLSEAQICGVFSGQITDWNQLVSTTSGPIRVVFRSDNSGTSFSFLNHLSAVCPTNKIAAGTVANLPNGTAFAFDFKTSQTFSGVDTAGQPTGASAYVNAYAVKLGASGNAGITTAVNDSLVDGSIGYAEAANGINAPAAFASVKNSHSGLTVNPSTGFGPTALAVSLSYDQSISDSVTVSDPVTHLPIGGRPILQPLPTTSQCIAVVNPSDYADPVSGYPILAVTYLLANAQSNANVAAVRGLMFSPYNTTTRPSVTKIGHILNGYSWLANADLTNTTGQTKVNGCVN